MKGTNSVAAGLSPGFAGCEGCSAGWPEPGETDEIGSTEESGRTGDVCGVRGLVCLVGLLLEGCTKGVLRLEWSLAAAGDGVRLFAVVELFVTTSADVLKGLTLLEMILVGAFLLTSGVVEVHTDLIGSHIVFRDTVNVLFSLGARGFRLSATVVVELLSVGERMMLWNLLEP